ncbi:hypothetical protein [Teredinibacter sp. KSP-S5-2]|uniref:hypothetical protein n=1 Tax=Teredinibacter sp. KSP-S5-2 TaxID=3034506 RepID=UPI00293454F6|nr:hypothetical protein [Teredinibacter sp. KSP-S5-2]WNO07872.1 hypothetical protein P5V12_12870 [Teredinibacter sp. KSP-S5-2]
MIRKLIKMIRAFLMVLWCIAMLLLGGFVAVENPGDVAPQMLGIPLPELSLGSYLAVFLSLGLMLGFLTSFFADQAKGWRKSNALRKAQKEVALLKQSQAKG